jgi:hypothetical protein
MGTGTWQQLKALPCTCPLGSRSWQLADWSDVVFYKNAELLIIAHQGTANAASVFYSGAAQFAAGIGQISYTSWVALDIALLGGLAYAQHDLPPPQKRGFFQIS